MNTLYNSGRLLVLAVIVGILSMFTTSCDDPYEMDLPLAVTQTSLTFGAGGGSTHVLVYAVGGWTATLKNPADASWVTLEKASGKDNGEFIFNYAVNPGVARKAVIVITAGENTKEVEMNQSGFLTSASMVFTNKTMRLPNWETNVAAGFSTNMGLALDRFTSKVEYGDFDTSTNADNSNVETTVATADDPGWLTDIVVEEDTVRFKVAENTLGEARKARLTVSVRNTVSGTTYSASTIVTQEAVDGYVRFNLPDQNAEVESYEKTVNFLWDTNMEMFFSKMNISVAYSEAGEEWISDFKPTATGLQAKIHESKYDGERHATITVSYSGEHGTITATRKVLQARPAIEVPFADLRANLSAAGTVALEKGFIKAQVISDPANPNLETNPQPTWNTVDLTESTRTAYVQSMDGTYGLRIKLASEDDASALPRYATVNIALAGLTLEREDNPVRYTLSGVSASSIIESTAGTASSLPVKERYIDQLSESDYYTFVTFKDMQLAMRYGAWGNMHESFAQKTDLIPTGASGATRCDCVPRYFLDSRGGVIPMVINAQVPWRRMGAYVPQGSGTVKGIVVYSPLKRYNQNGEMGKYQFRVMDQSDINLNATTSSYSNIIAEWQWTGGSSTIKLSNKKDIAANLGTGTMTTSADIDDSGVAVTTSWLMKTFPASTFTEYLACRYNAKWWNFTTGVGENISWTFSTKGLTGSHLTFAMTGSIGKQAQPNTGAPANWALEYSTDGTNFTTLNSNFIFYPSPIYANTTGTIPAGNPEYIFNLPDALMGQDKVVVRMRAVSKKYATADGLTAGTITDSNIVATYLRFESIVIRYNK